MASNTIADILEKMKQGNITEKWGAMIAFGRTRLNRVLEQQWLEKYDGRNYVPSFSGEMYLNDLKTERGVLHDVLLGRPRLSFQPAALDNSRALLTLRILGGTFTVLHETTGVMYSYDISEDQGYTLTVKLDLSVVVGVVDRLGRVTLDLSKGIEFACNLAAPAASQKKIGEFFKELFRKLPSERQVYELGILNLKGGSPLSPTNFIILTQRAPGAEQPGALNVEDGAVLVCVKLRGSALGGDIPPPSFPYLLPDPENGKPDISATMVLAEQFISQSDDDKLELIRSVLFPGARNVFVEHSRYVPRDMVIFGSLDPSKTSLVIEPAMHAIKAGGTPLSYKAYLDGVQVNNVKWSVKSLNTRRSSGSINELTGLYLPVSAAQIGKGLVRNIVTATWVEPANGDIPARTHRVSALLLVSSRPMSISPSCVPRRVGGAAVTFVASALSGSQLTWSKPAYGTLVANGNTAIYTPPTQDLPTHFHVQPIEVTDGTGESVQASVLLSNFAPTMEIDPPFVNSIARSGSVKLEAMTDAPPELERRWEVLGDNAGSVRDGVFTAPANSSTPFSVVKCDIYYADLLVRTGYSIIKLKNFDVESGWSKLNKFALTALRSDKVYDNGFQQLPIEIELQTDGDRLTPDEEASVKLYYYRSRQQVQEVIAGQEGIPYDPAKPLLWAQTEIANRFTPYGGTLATDADIELTAEQPNHVTLFMVTRDSQVTQFYASVENENGLSFDSDMHPGHEDGTIKLTPIESPRTNPGYFTFYRRRIEGGGTGDPANGENDEDFDNYLETTDYHDLNYLQSGQKALTFSELEFAAPKSGDPSPESITLWESKFENEKMFSFTGYGFNKRNSGDRNVMHFDSLIKDNTLLKPVLNKVIKGGVAEGRLLISLFRRMDIQQEDWRGKPGNKDLHPLRGAGLNLILTDNEGHRHPIRIMYRSGNRNRLEVIPLPE